MTRRGFSWADANVLLTGASSGIGRDLAVRLAAQGAHLALVARRGELLDSLADEITADGWARPHVMPADLAVPGAARDVADAALESLDGRVDILVNNAGASLTAAQTRTGDDDPARAVYEVNLWSPLALTAAVVPGMLARGEGTVVNVTSTIQAVPLPLLGYYGSSKAALAQATRALRRELAETPVRVVEVVPGATDTALRDIDELPWKTTPPRALPPVSPDATAAAIVRGLQRGTDRIVYPRYSIAPLEVPAVGRLVARVGGRRVNTVDAL